jgi:elongator complex protein 3
MMNKYNFKPQIYADQILPILQEILEIESWSERKLNKILSKYPRDGKAIFSRDQLVMGYDYLCKEGKMIANELIKERIRMKPTRTISGVAPVTVLTKPFPCPGRCIYCPNDIRMPKSYLADEPGAQRAERNAFDPYLQTYNRLLALKNTGHNTDKVEIIVLGGTWSFYPEEYQIWFIKRCFDALNDFDINDRRHEVKTINDFEEADKIPSKTTDGRRKGYNELVTSVVRDKGKEFFTKTEFATWEELELQQINNVTANTRCVGLVIETRPDYIDEREVLKIRRLGATKVQLGVQSLDDNIQKLNKRGHGIAETQKAFRLLRMAGFKIHAHWMPNQLGATVQSDIDDYLKLWDITIIPDELKIYPTSIIANTELADRYTKSEYKPYTYDELLEVLTNAMLSTPRFCRLTRVIRDIPSTDIVAGNKLTNFRQIAEQKLEKMEKSCQCIRCREIKNAKVSFDDLGLEIIEYNTIIGKEYFISFKTKATDKIVGFLRLSVFNNKISANNFLVELRNCTIIREVHVYGQVVNIGNKQKNKPQHLGLGEKMINIAEQITKDNNYNKIAVISAIGTRKYYEKFDFHLADLYMTKEL